MGGIKKVTKQCTRSKPEVNIEESNRLYSAEGAKPGVYVEEATATLTVCN